MFCSKFGQEYVLILAKRKHDTEKRWAEFAWDKQIKMPSKPFRLPKPTVLESMFKVSSNPEFLRAISVGLYQMTFFLCVFK